MSCRWHQADSRARPSTLYAMPRPGLVTDSTLAAVQQKSCVFGPTFPRRSCRHQERPRALRRRARARRQQGRGGHLLKGERALPGRAPVRGSAGLARLECAPVRGGRNREVQACRRPAHRGARERAAHPARPVERGAPRAWRSGPASQPAPAAKSGTDRQRRPVREQAPTCLLHIASILNYARSTSRRTQLASARALRGDEAARGVAQAQAAARVVARAAPVRCCNAAPRIQRAALLHAARCLVVRPAHP